jgi:LTXXQ motif family protein
VSLEEIECVSPPTASGNRDRRPAFAVRERRVGAAIILSNRSAEISGGAARYGRHPLNAMVDAIKTVRPNLKNFYASLSDDQKARFNTMGPPPKAASSGGQQ